MGSGVLWLGQNKEHIAHGMCWKFGFEVSNRGFVFLDSASLATWAFLPKPLNLKPSNPKHSNRKPLNPKPEAPAGNMDLIKAAESFAKA